MLRPEWSGRVALGKYFAFEICHTLLLVARHSEAATNVITLREWLKPLLTVTTTALQTDTCNAYLCGKMTKGKMRLFYASNQDVLCCKVSNLMKLWRQDSDPHLSTINGKCNEHSRSCHIMAKKCTAPHLSIRDVVGS